MAESGSASRRFSCPSCGGGLRYDIVESRMKCDRCGSLTELSDLPEDPADEMMDVTEYHCPQCGAAVCSSDQEITSFCSFCGSDVVLTGKLGRMKRPARIVPFRVTREKCETAYRNHLKKYLLTPTDLKKAETVSHFRPVYVPFWSYHVRANGPMTLEGTRKESEKGGRYIATYDLSMEAKISQDDILYDASQVFEDDTAARLCHTAREAKPFHPAYLSGFFAQGPDVPAETYETEAAASAVRLFAEKVKRETGMDSVKVVGHAKRNFGLPNPRFREELVMMPVWLLAHRQGQRVVYTAVNGQNGEVVSDVPVSSGKIMGLISAVAMGLFLLLQRFLTLKPEGLLTLCAMISLVAQNQFSGFQKRLFLRQTRASEPDYGEPGGIYNGPAQRLLKEQKRDVKETITAFCMLIATILFYIIIALIKNGDNMTDMAGFVRSILAGIPVKTWQTAMVGICFLVMIRHAFRRWKEGQSGPSWPRLISCAACAAGLTALILAQAEDMIYYACVAAMLISSMVELIMVNIAHNKYVSRPVPYFGGEEEENA